MSSLDRKQYPLILTRMKKDMVDEEYVKGMFMLGEYYRGQRD